MQHRIMMIAVVALLLLCAPLRQCARAPELGQVLQEAPLEQLASSQPTTGAAPALQQHGGGVKQDDDYDRPICEDKAYRRSLLKVLGLGLGQWAQRRASAPHHLLLPPPPWRTPHLPCKPSPDAAADPGDSLHRCAASPPGPGCGGSECKVLAGLRRRRVLRPCHPPPPTARPAVPVMHDWPRMINDPPSRRLVRRPQGVCTKHRAGGGAAGSDSAAFLGRWAQDMPAGMPIPQPVPMLC